MEWFRNQTVFLEETEPTFDELRRLVALHAYAGKRIHDANIAAVMIAHNVRTIITTNTEDFSGIEGLHVLSPEQATRAFGEGRS
jgi:predicted nucleic acid-binding protein